MQLPLSGCGGGGNGGGGSSGSPDFSLSVTGSSSVTVSQGQTQSFTVSGTSYSGFSAPVNVSITGLPAGVTVAPSSFTLNAGSPQTIQISASPTAPIVSGATVTIQGASGALTHQVTLSLTVAGQPGITLSSPTSISIIPGTIQPLSVSIAGVNGFSGLVSLSISGLPAGVTASPLVVTGYPGSTVSFSLIASSTASGSATATISGTSGTLTASTQTTLSVSTGPDFLLSTGIYTGMEVAAGSFGYLTVTATSYNGFSAPISVTITGLPPGVTAAPSTFFITPNAGGATQQVTITSSVNAPVPATVPVTVQGTGGSLSHQTIFQFMVIAPSITLSPQPTPLAVPAGAIAQTELFVFGLSGNVVGNVTETISGLPTGVTAMPTTATLPAATASQVFYLQAAATGAQAGSATFTLTYGPYTAKATMPISIGPPQTGTPVPIKSRSSYIRTGSTTDFGALPAPTLTLFHSATGNFFSSDPYLGHLYVVSSTTQKLVATINIPGAFGIDQAPDGSVIYVGTFGGDIYLVDPVKLTITKRYPTSTISQYGFPANAVFALADGKLLLMQYFLVPYFSWVDGNGPFALWNPADNSIVKFVTTLDNGPMPERLSCFDHPGHIILTAGRTRAVLAPVPSGSGNEQLCSLDPEAGTWNLNSTIFDLPTQDTNSVAEFASSPDGKTIATFDETKVYVLDSTTMQVKNSFPAPVKRFNFVYPNMIIGPDNQTLYLDDPSTGTVLYAYNLTSGQLVGWMPEVEASSSYKWYEPSNPYMQAISSNGLIAGPLDNGIGLIDTQTVNPPPVGTNFNFSALQTATGPTSGSTDTAWLENQYPQTSPAPLGSVYFGANSASDVSYGSSLIYASSPAGAPGPVDVRITTTDGGQQLLPEAYSYGPWILEAPTSYATAEGGGPAQVFGYGFGPVQRISSSQQYATPPSNLSVSVGGQSVNLTGFVPSPYAGSYPVTEPFPTQGIEYTVPSGVVGLSSPITVTASSGNSAGAAATMQYLPATQRFSSPGSEMVDGIYDSHRNLYYFTDGNQIRVFSRAQGQWLTPIPIPAPAHPGGSQFLFSLALSPDGSKLAVTDAGAYAVYVLNPGSPSSITTYQLASDPTNTPGGVAVTNSGTVYYTTFDQAGDGQFDLYWINPSTGKSAYVPSSSFPWVQGDDVNLFDLRLVMSADGSRVFFSNDGQIGYINTTTNIFQLTSASPLAEFAGGSEVALSPDQSRVAIAGLITDFSGNPIAMQSIGWNAGYDAAYVYGAAFSSDGTALFQPGVNTIDVYDGFAGNFISRISLPFQLSEFFRALVSDGTDNVLVAITGSGDGIAIIDLSAVARPAARSYVTAPPSSFADTAISAAATTQTNSQTANPKTSAATRTTQRPFASYYRPRALPRFSHAPLSTHTQASPQ